MARAYNRVLTNERRGQKWSRLYILKPHDILYIKYLTPNDNITGIMLCKKGNGNLFLEYYFKATPPHLR